MFDLYKGSVKYWEECFMEGGFTYDGRFYRSIEEAHELLAGGYVVCARLEEDKERRGRLRLHKIYIQNTLERGNGWYDLFTYTRNSDNLKTGYYLCRIQELNIDKNGYVNMVVETVTYLGESITTVPEDYTVRIVRSLMVMDKEEDMPVWQFLAAKLSPIAIAQYGRYLGRFNTESVKEHGYTETKVMERLLAGDATVLTEVSKLLLEPTKVEQAEEYIENNRRKEEFGMRYPLLAKKLQNKAGNEIEDFLQKHLGDFEGRGLETEIPEGSSAGEVVLYKVEAALKYWKEIHAKQKKAKKKPA